MNEKLKKRVIFVITDTGYWILTIVALVLLLGVFTSFLRWDLGSLRLIWSLKWLTLRTVMVVSLIFALIGDWVNVSRN